MIKKQSLLFFLYITSIALALTSCTVVEEKNYPYVGYDKAVLKPVETSVERYKRYPWERWPLKFDLKGKPITDPFMLRGDELAAEQSYDRALNYYQKALTGSLPYDTHEALTMRVASTQLALDRSQDALNGISNFFRKVGLDVNDVDSRFSLIFAFSYGRLGDFDQSLAWFSRTYRVAGASGPMSDSASAGLRMLLRTISEEKLIDLQGVWSDDSFIAELVGQERRVRAQQGKQVFAGKAPFWEQSGLSFESSSPAQTVAHAAAGSTIGMLLPLSGKYESLGKSTQQGIELAFKANDPSVTPQIIARDTAGEYEKAIFQLDNLVQQDKVGLVLGPLLSSLAGAVAPRVQNGNLPLITFSKRRDFIPGNNVFRFGPTSKSQVDSILEAAVNTLGLRRFALIFPETVSGNEYADEFRRKAGELGVELVFDTSYFKGDIDYQGLVAKELESKNVEAVFFPDTVESAAKFFVGITPGARAKLKILGPANWDNARALSRSRNILDGAIFVSPFNERSNRGVVRQFVETYKSYYGKSPDFLAAQGFDAATMVLAAMRRTSNSGVPFLEAFRAIDRYEGLTGMISVELNGEIEREFDVVELTSKGILTVEKDTPIFTGDPVVSGADLEGTQDKRLEGVTSARPIRTQPQRSWDNFESKSPVYRN